MVNRQIPLVLDFDAEEGRLPLSIKLALGDNLVEIISAGTKVPTRKVVEISNAVDDQKSLTIRVVQGMSKRPEANAAVASYVVSEMPPGPAGTLSIALAISITPSFGINVSATGSDDQDYPVEMIDVGKPLGQKAIAAISEEEANDEEAPFDGVYDRAIFHKGTVSEEDLDEVQAYVHTGMYIGWLVENSLLAESFCAAEKDDIDAFAERKKTGADLYRSWNGVLHQDMLSEIGNAFSLHYFDFDRGQFLEDYAEVLAPESETMLVVDDTWEHFDKIRVRITLRFNEWSAKQTPSDDENIS